MFLAEKIAFLMTLPALQLQAVEIADLVMRQAQFFKRFEKGYEYKREMHLVCWYRESQHSHK